MEVIEMFWHEWLNWMIPGFQRFCTIFVNIDKCIYWQSSCDKTSYNEPNDIIADGKSLCGGFLQRCLLRGCYFLEIFPTKQLLKEGKEAFSGEGKHFGLKARMSAFPIELLSTCRENYLDSFSGLKTFQCGLNLHTPCLQKSLLKWDEVDYGANAVTYPTSCSVTDAKGWKGVSEFLRQYIRLGDIQKALILL